MNVQNDSLHVLESNLYLCFRLKNMHVSYGKIFEEITVVIRNSHLVNLLMCEIADWMPEEDKSNQFLDMGTA